MGIVEIFLGRSAEVALIIAGIHGDEKSGVEVANWVRVKLRKRLRERKPSAFTTIVIPIVFPETYGESHREFEWSAPQEGNRKKPIPAERYLIPTNRQYPPPGQPLQFVIDRGGPASPDGARITRDAHSPPRRVPSGVPLLDGTVQLLSLIELVKPVRIASVHAHSAVPKPAVGQDAPGIYVDPVYEYKSGVTGGGCQADLLYPTRKNEWGTLLCKVDVTKDPGLPELGRVAVLNDLYRQGKLPKKVKDKVDMARSSYIVGDKIKAAGEFIAASNAAGITLKPEFGRRSEDSLTLKLAAKMRPSLVPGNHLERSGLEVVHYDADPLVTATLPVKPKWLVTPDGFSLGDWAPVTAKGPLGERKGAPVITVEVYDKKDSGAFRDEVQLVDEDGRRLESGLSEKDKQLAKKVNKARSRDLQAYADALIEVFLERLS
ncbi:MAG: hypothetical protein ACXVCF_18665 [Isosphaeraceae bacterium]